MAIVQRAKASHIASRLDDPLGPLIEPDVEARIFAHLRMELQRQEVRTAPECLMVVHVARCQQLHSVGQIEGIAVPMKHWHPVEMSERT